MGDCSKCLPARCCNYVSLKIDTPKEREDFDELLWQISHQKISIYVEEGEWFLSFDSRCQHLGLDNRCQIYDSRPEICRDYSNTWCAYDSEYDFDMEFQDYEQLKEYVTLRFRPGGKKTVRHLSHRWRPRSWAAPRPPLTEMEL